MDKKERATFVFRRQWALRHDPPDPRVDWQKIVLSMGFSLFFHPDQRVAARIEGGRGVVIVGIAFNPDNLDQEPIQTLFDCPDRSCFEKSLTELGGTYAILDISPTEIRAYTDCSGMMGIYFSGRAAASCPALLGDLETDSAIVRDFAFGIGNDWYTGMTTPFMGVQKLIPNCCLDLPKAKVERYWPKSDFISRDKPPNEKDIISDIADLLTNMMSGVLRQGSALCSITGGQDSRLNLAAAKKHWSDLSFFTLRGGPVKSQDVDIAGRLAQLTGISHTFFQVVPTPEWLDTCYNEIGADESIGARRAIAGTCLQLEGRDIIHVNGNLGALCKSYYWHNQAPEDFKVAAVATDFNAPGTTTFRGIQQWYETLPMKLEATVIYNLFYLEQRGGRWMAVGENCSRLFYESFTPFNHRKVFTLINTLPPEIQFGGQLLKKLTEHLAPELMQIPYCTFRRNWSKFIPERFKIPLRKVLRFYK